MIVIVTDSVACITKLEARQLGAVCVPMTYTIDGRTYPEGFADDNGDYEALIAGARDAITSQPASASYERVFRRLRHAGFEVLCLTISSRLSGAYVNAVRCANEIGEGIRVVDTRSCAIGIACLADKARSFISAGMGLEDAAREIESIRDKVKTLFSVKDMGPLRRSGRLGPVRQSVGTILNLQPLLTCVDGAVVACGTARGANETMKRLCGAVPAAAPDIAVQYISETGAAERLAADLREKCGDRVTFRKLGPVLGIHLGLTILGVMWFDP